MSDPFLEEQLERIRKLTERMSEMHNRAAEVSETIERDREALRQSPLHEVRDYRPYAADTSEDSEPEPTNRATVSDSSRRRRR